MDLFIGLIIFIAIISCIVLSINYSIQKSKYNKLNIDEQNQIETNPRYLLNQIKTRLDIIIIIMVAPYIWKLIKLIIIGKNISEIIN